MTGKIRETQRRVPIYPNIQITEIICFHLLPRCVDLRHEYGMISAYMYEVHYRRATLIKTKRGFESGRFGALKLGKLGLRCKANQCSDIVRTGGLGVPATLEI